jgi:CheY-like chemotaxis protein
MRVLVVEDVGFVRHNMERLLTQNKHSVASALSGEKSLEMLKSDHKIDVVITGLFMSGIGGIDLFREAQLIQCIGDSGRLTGPDFILTTTTERSSADSKKTAMVQQALDIGFVDVLLKPIDSAQLIARLRQVEMSRSGGVKNGGQNSESAGSDSSANPGSSSMPVANDYQIQTLQEIKNSLSQMQTDISTQINRLNEALETIGS